MELFTRLINRRQLWNIAYEENCRENVVYGVGSSNERKIIRKFEKEKKTNFKVNVYMHVLKINFLLQTTIFISCA